MFGSFVEGHLKNIQYDVYVGLRSATSKRMFRFLDKRFHHSNSCSFDLKDFAHEHIGLSRSYKDCGKLKEKLNAGIKELEEIGFLVPMTSEDRFHHEGRGRWRITFTRNRKKQHSGPTIDRADAQEQINLIAELINQGMTQATAEGLTRSFQADRIGRQIEYFDWLMQKKPEKIGEPGGYLVDAIQKDYAHPKGFVSRADREAREAARRQAERDKAEAGRREQEAKARDRAEWQAIEAYWQSLTPEQQSELQASADAQADPAELAKEIGPFKRIGRTARRDAYIRELLRAGKLGTIQE